ncbi:MAG: hypothetical protein ABH800_00695 [Candidatus Nealsonbacteria bacterium]
MQKTKIKIGGFFCDTKAFTLIDVLVGASLLLVVFFGIFGAYQLGLKTIELSRNKIVASAIANKQLEIIRNLPYESIGVKDSFPDGILEQTTTTIKNNIEYTVETRVDFVVDSADGSFLPEDECPNDYKKAEVKVFWGGRFPGGISFSTNITPKNLAQECATGGGILSVSIFDAYGLMVSSPLIEVVDPVSEEVIKTATPVDGEHLFSLATSTYKIIVSKSGYSTVRTYGIDEIAVPEKPNPIIIEGQFIETSFSIDKLSNFSIRTLSPWGEEAFTDSFLDETKISESENIRVFDGEINLATSSQGYLSSGFLSSVPIVSFSLLHWNELSFSDSEPHDTDLRYQLFYASGTDWLLIEDSELPGNSEGFDFSPVDISGLTCPQLKAKAVFSSMSTSSTPALYDWQISWITSEATPIPYAEFNLRGEKIIGLDSEEDPVYKYSQDHTSNNQGNSLLYNLEWDSYIFSIDPVTGLDLVDIDPSPQPVSLLPDTSLSIDLYLDAENSLLITVRDSETLDPVFSSQVRLYSAGLEYDNTQYTDSKGQTYFIPLDSGSYNLEIDAPGFTQFLGTVFVSGDVTKIINLERLE